MLRQSSRKSIGNFAKLIVVLAWCVLSVGEEAPCPQGRGPADADRAGLPDRVVSRIIARLPAAFELNRGQAAPETIYRWRAGGESLELRRGGVRLSWQERDTAERLDLRFIGANPEARIEAASQPLPGQNHYLIGNQESEWIRGVPTYEKIAYRGLYPGIDLVFYGRGREIEYDLIVAPGADPALIRMEFACQSGSARPAITPAGDLELTRGGTPVRIRRPLIYQEDATGREQIEGGYVLDGDGQVQFRVGRYDHTQSLVVDPIIDFSTFVGGTGSDTGYAVTVDGAGNIYVAGQTGSPNFPIRGGYDNSINGSSDAFIVKINPAGTAILFSTYLGGRNPGERAWDVEVDRDGRVYVCGETNSLNFPTVNAFQGFFRGGTDGFVSVLSSNGAELLFSTYLGGSSVDIPYGLALDPERNIYLTGGTRSNNFPTNNAFQTELKGRMDVFVTRMTVSGELLFSTYLGGQDTGLEVSEEETGYGIALDGLQNIYLTGITSSSTFPVRGAVQGGFGGVEDCFVVKLSSTGQSIIYSTYLGGTRADRGRAIAVDPYGQAVITGYTFFSDFPTVNAFQPNYRGNLDAFVAKLSANGRQLIFSTFLGGSGEENSGSLNDQVPPGAIAIDKTGNIYVGGKTSSTDFPVSQPIQPGLRGTTDAFLTKLDPAGSALIFSTLIGSSYASDMGTDERLLGMAIDSFGGIYITGQALQSDFPLTMPLQPVFGGGGSDAFLMRITTPDISGLAPVSAASYVGSTIAPDSIVSIFGSNLAAGIEAAGALPLPTSLQGTTVLVEDRFGVGRLARLFFVSPNQINLQIPPETAAGRAVIRVSNESTLPGNGQRSAIIQVDQLAPSIFTANSDGRDAPAAFIQRVRGDGSIDYEPVFQSNFLGRFEPRAIDLGPPTDDVYLVLFGTGWRRATGLEKVVVRVGGIEVPVLYAGQQGQFIGLDQINLRLPRQLAGRGVVTLSLEVDSMIANLVNLQFR